METGYEDVQEGVGLTVLLEDVQVLLLEIDVDTRLLALPDDKEHVIRSTYTGEFCGKDGVDMVLLGIVDSRR